jgi:hypothetical protein
MSQNKPLLLISCLPQVFCHSDRALTNTEAAGPQPSLAQFLVGLFNLFDSLLVKHKVIMRMKWDCGSFFFWGGGTEAWTQGLYIEPLYQLFCKGFLR